MVQKVNPISVRLKLNRSSDSSWFSDYYYGKLLYQAFFKNGSYALRSSFFKGRMACKTAGMKAALLTFKGLLAYGKGSWCA
jgi:hypothetical protein